MYRIRPSITDFIDGPSRTRTGREDEGTIKQGGKLQLTVCFHFLSLHHGRWLHQSFAMQGIFK
jgi:hypothetical protein